MQQKLKLFSWQGHNKSGTFQQGELAETDLLSAKVNLLSQGIQITKLQEQRSRDLFKRSIATAKLFAWLQQLATLLSAGIALQEALNTLQRLTKNRELKLVTAVVSKKIGKGVSFAQALKSQSIDKLVQPLIAIGEASGTLDITIKRLADLLERKHRMKVGLIKALSYPCFVLIAVFVIVIAMLLFVVPQFSTIFSGFGVKLPVYTQLLLNLSNTVRQYGLVVFIVTGAIITSLVLLLKKITWLKKKSEDCLLHLPLVGTLILNSTMMHFSSVLSVLLQSGVPLLEGLNYIEPLLTFSIYKNSIKKIRDSLQQGESLQLSMQQTGLFPDLALAMIATGESSGRLEQQLQELAKHYEQQNQDIIEQLSIFIEPVFIIILGVVVGGIVLALYLPIFQLGSVV